MGSEVNQQLLSAYIRMVVQEVADARVPNQLIAPDGGSADDVTELDEFATVGAGGCGNTLASGNIQGYTAPLGMNPDRLGRQKNKGRKKRKK